MRRLIGCLVIASIAAGAAVAGDGRWIHVRVDDAGGESGRVDIQVPLEMVSALLPVIKTNHGRGTISLDGKSVDVAELREYWAAVRAAKDGEYVTVKDADSVVKIAKTGGIFRINVDENGGGSRVRVKLPISFVDAVLAGGNTLDLRAIGGALAEAPAGEILTVDDEDSHIRIWIDDEPAPSREDRP